MPPLRFGALAAGDTAPVVTQPEAGRVTLWFPRKPQRGGLRHSCVSYFRTLLRRRLASALIAAFALLVIAGCSGSGDGAAGAAPNLDVDNAAAGGAARGVPGPDFSAPQGAAEYASGADQGKRGQSTELTDVTPQAQIKTAAISLEADDVDEVLGQVSDVVVVAQGEIESEDTSTNRQGKAVNSRLVLRVPVEEFEATVRKIAELGVRYSLETSVEDVTAEVADINSRVRSAEDSIAQLRRLFSQAKKLGDIIALENELSQRQADLEALQAQQRALADLTTMSTITVTVRQTTQPPPPADDDRAGGFIAGLQSGWDAMVGFVRAMSHGLGLVLPLGTLLVLIGVAGYLLLRRVTPRMRPHANE